MSYEDSGSPHPLPDPAPTPEIPYDTGNAPHELHPQSTESHTHDKFPQFFLHQIQFHHTSATPPAPPEYRDQFSTPAQHLPELIHLVSQIPL